MGGAAAASWSGVVAAAADPAPASHAATIAAAQLPRTRFLPSELIAAPCAEKGECQLLPHTRVGSAAEPTGLRRGRASRVPASIVLVQLRRHLRQIRNFRAVHGAN